MWVLLQIFFSFEEKNEKKNKVLKVLSLLKEYFAGIHFLKKKEKNPKKSIGIWKVPRKEFYHFLHILNFSKVSITSKHDFEVSTRPFSFCWIVFLYFDSVLPIFTAFFPFIFHCVLPAFSCSFWQYLRCK